MFKLLKRDVLFKFMQRSGGRPDTKVFLELLCVNKWRQEIKFEFTNLFPREKTVTELCVVGVSFTCINHGRKKG